MTSKNLNLAAIGCCIAIYATELRSENSILELSIASNSEFSQSFTLADLKAMEAREFTTTTIWTDGLNSFTGVSLDVFLAAHNVSEGTVQASAINDYTVEIPVSEAKLDGPMIAYELNGEPMSIRDKGPLWIVFPYDSKPEYQTEVTYSRSIWQLDRITITE